MEEEKTIEENTKRTTRKEENEKNRKRTKKIIIINWYLHYCIAMYVNSFCSLEYDKRKSYQWCLH